MLGPFVLIVFWANPRSTARNESAFEVHDSAGPSDPGFAAERLAAFAHCGGIGTNSYRHMAETYVFYHRAGLLTSQTMLSARLAVLSLTC